MAAGNTQSCGIRLLIQWMIDLESLVNIPQRIDNTPINDSIEMPLIPFGKPENERMLMMMKRLLICFAAGCLGALICSLVSWQAGELGVARWAGVSIAPTIRAGWLYPRIVWGGLWGLLFVIPVLKSRFLIKGTILSLVPTAAQLLYFFPYTTPYGLFGVNLGMWTPAYVLVLNWIWGVVAASVIRFSR
jgi:hypothetical protein